MEMTKVSKKGLIISLFALIVALVVTTTSTYAWFAMNTSVSASGMTVTAQTDNAFLIIQQGTTFDSTGDDISATSTLNAQLKPVAPATTLTSANVNTLGSWGTAISSDPDDANSAAVVTALTTGDLSNYVAKESFMIGLVQNSAAATNPLRLASVTLPANTGISVVVVCGTNIYTHNATAATIAGETLAAANQVTTSGVQVDVYIFINGADANVKTTNATALTGSVALGFTIDA